MIKEIVGFSDYMVSDNGNIWSVKSKRWLKPQKNNSGYYTIGLSVSGNVTKKLIHRLVWETFIGIIPDGLEINHKDEDKSNNQLSNLELLSHKENCNFGTRNDRAGDGHRKYATDEEAKQIKKIKNAEWRENNREHRRKYQKQYYESHKTLK